MTKRKIALAPNRFRAFALLLLWSGTVGAGSLGLALYSSLPGRDGAPPHVWPTASCLPLDGKRLTLVLFAHPRCPCTRASLEELAHIMADAQNRLRAYVVFFSPRTEDGAWPMTRLWRCARSIPGVTPVQDPDGEQARLFGAGTSGQTLVYDTLGNAVFAGGITFARGHAGDNEGCSAIVALLNGDRPRLRTTPTFGCSLEASPCR